MSWSANLLNSDLAHLALVRVYSNEKFPERGTNVLRTATAAGDTSLPVSTETDYAEGDLLEIDQGGLNFEVVSLQGLDGGSGPDFTWVLAGPMQNAHSLGEAVNKTRNVSERRFAGDTERDLSPLDFQTRNQIENSLQTAIDATKVALGIKESGE